MHMTNAQNIWNLASNADWLQRSLKRGGCSYSDTSDSGTWKRDIGKSWRKDGSVIEQPNVHPSCPCCVRALLQKSSTRTQAVNAVNPCDGVTKMLLRDKQSIVVDGFLMVERSDVWHREFLQPRRGTQRRKYALTLLRTLRPQSTVTGLLARRRIM